MLKTMRAKIYPLGGSGFNQVLIQVQQDANIGIFAGCCGLIYFHCTLRTFLKLPSCVTGYSRSYEKFHSDPGQIYICGLFLFPIILLESIREIVFWWPGQITIHYIIEKRTRINYTENVSSRIFIYSSFKAKHNLSVKTQFLRRVLYNFAPFILSSSP